MHVVATLPADNGQYCTIATYQVDSQFPIDTIKAQVSPIEGSAKVEMSLFLLTTASSDDASDAGGHVLFMDLAQKFYEILDKDGSHLHVQQMKGQILGDGSDSANRAMQLTFLDGTVQVIDLTPRCIGGSSMTCLATLKTTGRIQQVTPATN